MTRRVGVQWPIFPGFSARQSLPCTPSGFTVGDPGLLFAVWWSWGPSLGEQVAAEGDPGYHDVGTPDGQRLVSHRPIYEGRQAVEAHDHPVIVSHGNHGLPRSNGAQLQPPGPRHPRRPMTKSLFNRLSGVVMGTRP